MNLYETEWADSKSATFIFHMFAYIRVLGLSTFFSMFLHIISCNYIFCPFWSQTWRNQGRNGYPPPFRLLVLNFFRSIPNNKFCSFKIRNLKIGGKGNSLEESTKVLIELDDNLPMGGGCWLKSAIQVERCEWKEQNIIVYLDILSGKGVDQPLTPDEIAHFKYTPITTADVARSFSVYKTLLADNRQSFTFENLRQTFVTRCNAE